MKLGDPPNFPNIDEKWYYCYLCGGINVAATDLLTNGAFTTATTGWTAGNSATLAVATGAPFTEKYLLITAGASNYPYAYQDVTVVAGTVYKISYWQQRGTTYKYRVYAYDNTGSADITSTAWLDGSEDWQSGWLDAEAPTSCVSMRIILQSNSLANDGTTFKFDTVECLSTHGTSAPMYPESMTILATEDGHRYCSDHYHWRFHHKYIDEVEIDITDDLE
jgi:hypothetical protein